MGIKVKKPDLSKYIPETLSAERFVHNFEKYCMVSPDESKKLYESLKKKYEES